MVNLLLLVIGTMVDVLPALVIVAPVLAPAMTQLGFDPLHFAMVMILTLNVGNITPPVGMSLMTTAQIAGVSYESAIRASLPFYVSFLAVIVIVSVWPQAVLWLPAPAALRRGHGSRAHRKPMSLARTSGVPL